MGVNTSLHLIWSSVLQLDSETSHEPDNEEDQPTVHGMDTLFRQGETSPNLVY